MGTFTFTSPDGQPFEVKGPDGLTEEQAKAIFDKQVSTGSLVGFKPGQSLSSASQAAAGLASAQSSLTQSLSKIGGGIASLADSAKATITGAISKLPVTNPIGTTDFTKTLSAIAPIGSLNIPSMTATLAQAKNLVGQASSALSNTKGVGSFGFDAKQLESAGFLKPGMSNLVSAAGATLSKVVSSPAAWTGKDGITSVSGLLNNPTAQSLTQQNLMAKGVAGLAAVGIPVNNLSASQLSGMALNAAKSIPGAEAFAKGLPIPGDATGKIKAGFDAAVRDGAFAVDLAKEKIAEPFKEQEVPVPATDTVNRATLNAACTRIAGDPKIPTPNYGPPNINGFV